MNSFLKKNTKWNWHIKKFVITCLLIIPSVIIKFLCENAFLSLLLIIPVIYIVWLIGEKIYRCPYCKHSIQLQLHIYKDTKCPSCGKRLNTSNLNE